jgi:hypothetical protein
VLFLRDMSKIPVSFSCAPEFLQLIDARAKTLGMSRTQYISQLIRRDLEHAARGESFTLAEDAAPIYQAEKKRKRANE